MRRFLLLIPVLLGVSAVCCMREDEVRCEEAVARLEECCPGTDLSQISCTYVAGACSTNYPDLSIDESQCISDMDCGELRSAGVCARAEHASDPPPATGEGGGTQEEQPVCP
ncbi:MAG: hypothetical protein IT372_08960 [Polyangiaceae bacterium]|nr:hypothetical protein [Polyangiaceae bacterium]